MSFEGERNGGRGMKGRHSQAEERGSHRPRQKRKSTARKVVGGVIGSIGEILLVAAVVIALYVVWQLWWTGVVSQQTQEQDAQAYTSSWTSAKQAGSYKVAPAHEAATAPVESGSYIRGSVIAKIYIPRFGARWARNVVEGTSQEDLNLHGLGHYETSQKAGAVGNFAAAGHRAGYGEPLAHVDEFKTGDKIIVRTAHYWYVYDYTSHEIVTPDQAEVVAPVPHQAGQTPTQRLITLTTCEPRYSTATHRWVSYGKLSSWSNVSEGIPAALAGKDANGQVTFSQEEKPSLTTSFAALPDTGKIALIAFLAYAVTYLAAAFSLRYGALRAHLRTPAEDRPLFSLFSWINRLQPGPAAIRAVLLILLVVGLVAALFQWGYPLAAANIPYLRFSSNYVSVN